MICLLFIIYPLPSPQRGPGEDPQAPLAGSLGHRLHILIKAFLFNWLFCCLVTQSCPTLCDPMDCSTPVFPVFTISLSLLKLMFIESVMPSNHLILCCPLLLWSSVFPSLRVFSNESFLLIMWPKYWSFSFSIHPSNELFRVDFLQDLLI